MRTPAVLQLLGLQHWQLQDAPEHLTDHHGLSFLLDDGSERARLYAGLRQAMINGTVVEYITQEDTSAERKGLIRM